MAKVFDFLKKRWLVIFQFLVIMSLIFWKLGGVASNVPDPNGCKNNYKFLNQRVVCQYSEGVEIDKISSLKHEVKTIADSFYDIGKQRIVQINNVIIGSHR